MCVRSKRPSPAALVELEMRGAGWMANHEPRAEAGRGEMV